MPRLSRADALRLGVLEPKLALPALPDLKRPGPRSSTRPVPRISKRAWWLVQPRGPCFEFHAFTPEVRSGYNTHCGGSPDRTRSISRTPRCKLAPSAARVRSAERTSQPHPAGQESWSGNFSLIRRKSECLSPMRKGKKVLDMPRPVRAEFCIDI